ncbi:MAG: class I SAM-dependent methyltransferase [Armatimonadota bacterium]
MCNPDERLPREALELLQERLAQGRGVPELVELLRNIIRRKGRLTFAEFMQAALYHPQYGYYSSPSLRIGPGGDYLTSPEISSIFGLCLGRHLVRISAEIGLPNELQIVEVGGGSGKLCRDVLTALLKESRIQPKYMVVERNQNWTAAQKKLLRAAGLVQLVSWASDLSELPENSIEGFIIANELIDSFPVHRVTVEHGKLLEIYVGLSKNEFTDQLGELSTNELRRYLEESGIALTEGHQAEINLCAHSWLKLVASRLRAGAVLIIDYGYTAQELFSGRFPKGTILCYYKHTTNTNPYKRVGQQDITAHVDFSALARWSSNFGLMPDALTSQRDLLFFEGAAEMAKSPTQKRELQELTNPNGLGRLKLLTLRRWPNQ